MGRARTPLAGIAERRDPNEIALRAIVIAAAVATSYIHATLGGPMFTLNAVGYLTLSAALVVPLALARRVRWLTRLALLGFTTATIVGWLFMGARFELAYIDKGIEVALVAFLLADIWRADGPPWRAPSRIARAVVRLGNGRMEPKPLSGSAGRSNSRAVDEPPHRKVG
jgi:hypothetical protein